MYIILQSKMIRVLISKYKVFYLYKTNIYIIYCDIELYLKFLEIIPLK